MTILVGADPEVFMLKDGKFLSAHGMIKGDKRNPFKVNKGAVQVDGMALEFNIDPAGTEEEFVLNIETVFSTLRGMVPDYDVVATPVADFDVDYLKQQPTEALELGCDPDYNGWTGGVNPRPNGDKPMRTASGHVHVGWCSDQNIDSAEHKENCMAVTRQLDFFLGLPSLLFDRDNRRREMYGKAGAFRPKAYGTEYRVLSNVWLNSKQLMSWVYRNTQIAMASMNDQLAFKFGDIQEVINTSNVDEANAIIKAAKIPLPEGL